VRLLLDTHAFLWAAADPDQLRANARAASFATPKRGTIAFCLVNRRARVILTGRPFSA